MLRLTRLGTALTLAALALSGCVVEDHPYHPQPQAYYRPAPPPPVYYHPPPPVYYHPPPPAYHPQPQVSVGVHVTE